MLDNLEFSLKYIFRYLAYQIFLGLQVVDIVLYLTYILT